jgi:hypothetical protein
VVAVAVRVGTREVLEVGVVAGLLGRDAAGRVVDEEHLEEVESLVVKVGADGGVRVALPLGEGSLEVGIRGDSGPDILSRGTEKTDEGESNVSLRQPGVALSNVSTLWVVTYRKILKISSISESPGKSGLRVHISAKMQPTDHMSTPVEYWRPPRRISGARYHKVTTSWV